MHICNWNNCSTSLYAPCWRKGGPFAKLLRLAHSSHAEKNNGVGLGAAISALVHDHQETVFRFERHSCSLPCRVWTIKGAWKANVADVDNGVLFRFYYWRNPLQQANWVDDDHLAAGRDHNVVPIAAVWWAPGPEAILHRAPCCLQLPCLGPWEVPPAVQHLGVLRIVPAGDHLKIGDVLAEGEVVKTSGVGEVTELLAF